MDKKERAEWAEQFVDADKAACQAVLATANAFLEATANLSEVREKWFTASASDCGAGPLKTITLRERVAELMTADLMDYRAALSEAGYLTGAEFECPRRLSAGLN